MSNNAQLQQAQKFLSRKEFEQAWAILKTIPDDPKARELMSKLLGMKKRLTTSQAKNSQTVLEQSKHHIQSKNFAEAWDTLSKMPDSRKSREWMEKLLNMQNVQLTSSTQIATASVNAGIFATIFSGGSSIILGIGITLIIAIIAIVVVVTNGEDSEDINPNDNNGTRGGIILNNSITYERFNGGTLIVHYPDDWSADTFTNGVEFSNVRSLASGDFVSLSSGQAYGMIDDILDEDRLNGLDKPLETVFQFYFQGDDGFYPEVVTNLTDLEPFTVNGRDGVIAYGDYSYEELDSEIAFIVVSLPNAFIAGGFVAPHGEIAEYEDILISMAGAVEYATTTFELTAQAIESTNQAISTAIVLTDEAIINGVSPVVPSATPPAETILQTTRSGLPIDSDNMFTVSYEASGTNGDFQTGAFVDCVPERLAYYELRQPLDEGYLVIGMSDVPMVFYDESDLFNINAADGDFGILFYIPLNDVGGRNLPNQPLDGRNTTNVFAIDSVGRRFAITRGDVEIEIIEDGNRVHLIGDFDVIGSLATRVSQGVLFLDSNIEISATGNFDLYLPSGWESTCEF